MHEKSGVSTADLPHRLQIETLLFRYARGIDRIDRSLLQSCFHPDATEQHGTFNGPALEFIEFVIPRLQRMSATSHHISNVWIELRGSIAVSEAYFMALHHYIDSHVPTELRISGRYIDRFEYRESDWRIAHRYVAMDLLREERITQTSSSTLGLERLNRGYADARDFVYQRWSELDAPSAPRV